MNGTDIEAIHDAIAALLTQDALFAQDLTALALGANNGALVPRVIEAFRTPQQVPQQHYPAFLLEKGDSEAESIGNDGGGFGVIGYTQQSMATDVLIGLVWHQQDHSRAYRQRLGIERAFIDLFLRHADAGGATLAYVRRVDFDRGGLHPLQTAQIVARVEYSQQRITR